MGLVESYLRLNGYFTLPEFQVQHPVPGQPGKFETATDLDILAVRFPWAAETVGRHQLAGEEPREILLADDPVLAVIRDVPDILIGEVKEGRAELNRAARNPEVLRAVLTRFGCCAREHVPHVVAELVRHGRAVTAGGHGVRLVAFGAVTDATVVRGYEAIALGHVVTFLQAYLQRHWEVLRHAQFKDPAFGFLMTLRKAMQTEDAEHGS